MRAVRFHAAKDIRVEDVPEPPSKLSEDQVLIKPNICGICGTDLHEYLAGPIVTPHEPHCYTGAKNPQILGHEFSAVVEDVGSAVANVAAGDRISVQPLISPRDDYYGRKGLFHLSEKMACVGLSWDWGGMAEYAVVNSYNAQRIPDNVSDEQAAVIEPAAVALYGVERAGIRAGSSVLISGAGPIGALSALCAQASGATTIIVSDPNPNRRRLVADVAPGLVVIDPQQDDPESVARDLTDDNVGVDAALECAGLEASLNACVQAVRRQGTVAQVGLHMKPASVDPMLWALKDISLEATWCYPTDIWPRIARMISAGILPVERVITARIDARDVVEKGFEALLDPAGEHLKILVSA